tara:strand:- start:1689 stop:2822 length:1134 start_codon:yes stop_codon:yes gene_type:complete
MNKSKSTKSTKSTKYSLPSNNCEVIIETSSSEEEITHSYNLRSNNRRNPLSSYLFNYSDSDSDDFLKEEEKGKEVRKEIKKETENNIIMTINKTPPRSPTSVIDLSTVPIESRLHSWATIKQEEYKPVTKLITKVKTPTKTQTKKFIKLPFTFNKGQRVMYFENSNWNSGTIINCYRIKNYKEQRYINKYKIYMDTLVYLDNNFSNYDKIVKGIGEEILILENQLVNKATDYLLTKIESLENNNTENNKNYKCNNCKLIKSTTVFNNVKELIECNDNYRGAIIDYDWEVNDLINQREDMFQDLDDVDDDLCDAKIEIKVLKDKVKKLKRKVKSLKKVKKKFTKYKKSISKNITKSINKPIKKVIQRVLKKSLRNYLE